jgi:hypothetical protein
MSTLNEIFALAADYAYALQLFIISHEIGHILQSVRPYNDPSGERRKAPLSEKSELKHPWSKELMADAFASTICHEDDVGILTRGPDRHNTETPG